MGLHFLSALAVSALMLGDVLAAYAYDHDAEAARLQSEGYTLIELDRHEEDPRREDIHRLFVTPAYADMQQFMDPPTSFKFGFHDINGDGHDELVISVEYGCDLDGCRLLGYSTADGTSWRKILDTYGLTVATPPPAQGSFPRLTVLSPGFGHHCEFSGASYVEVSH